MARVKGDKLTTRQRRFVEAYTGNATAAAIAAGYSEKTAEVIGHENLRKPKILAEIKARETIRSTPLIAMVVKCRSGRKGSCWSLRYNGASMSFTGDAVAVERVKKRKPVYRI